MDPSLAMETFLSLAGAGKLKDQQQIALKLHKAFPDETLYLNWALLPMILQTPNRCNGHTGTRSPISVSIAHRCLQTLLDQCLKLKTESPNNPHPPELEDPNNFWMVLKVLEMVGQSRPEDDHSKIVGIGKLKYSESLFEPLSTADQSKSASASAALSEASTIDQLANLSVQPGPSHTIESSRPELPEYISLAREDYFKIFDSRLGQIMRTKYLNLELMWRERAVEWANPTGLKELISRMKKRLESDDRNWSTMTTLNQAASSLIGLEEKAGVHEYNLVDQLYLELNAQQKLQICSERGYALARVDLRCRVRDPLLSELKDNFHPLSENLDQVVCSYYSQFGGKTCCFDDLAPYLKLLTTEDANKLGAALDRANETENHQCAAAAGQLEAFLCKQINLEKIRRSLNLTPQDQYAAEATRLMKNYLKYLPLGDDLPATTLQPADGMAILAAQALIEDWDGPNGSVANLYAATYILEECLSNSAQQYQARSLLIRLHRLLGNSPRNFHLFVGFGIKHIQYDTLSHLGLDRSSIFFGHNSLPSNEEDVESQPLRVLDLIEYPASFYEYIESDTSTWINNCYMSGNYIKVEDLSFFRHQINVSLQRKVMRMERIRLLLFERTRLSLSMSKKNETTRARLESDDPVQIWDGDEVEMNLFEVLQDCQSAVDNRDFTVIPDCRSWSASGTCHKTSLGPMIGKRWLWTLSTTYARIVTPQLKFLDHPLLSQPDFFSECSPFEVDLYQYSRTLSTMLQTTQPNLLDSQSQSLVDFFQRRNDQVEALVKPDANHSCSGRPVPPSQPLAVIHSVYEGLCLFEFAYEQYICGSSSPFKGNKIAKTLRATKTKIIAQVKTLDVLIQKLLDEMKGQLRGDHGKLTGTKCLFASPQILFPGQEEATKGFVSAAKWLEQLLKIHMEQRDTLAGWHSLIKMFL
ncbi:hypothetical protein PTTG_12678 [Puccinia triticina 1-1 BBBD Race 1]|uniref:Uncharacterized protein n=2 Tax=Puccinia triticina TaxID=208348 RepID=A0A180G5J0_PUCT1|nr:uncharacterized protein PtA15_17A5 [Puccinia triticina]OAV87906.1 hypothetical protein PTTG_12678 [Puccinia triticina 1-1 BBBD Race 1]WAQ92524.1 hypothetical protein PtA15_17A5 [Puccinia triticina]WAR63406.1 hypothetical protein PtB15_17B5 [Puccinia triticina]